MRSSIFRPSKRRNERGAVFVEFFAVVGLIIVLLGGILNYGTLFGDNIDLAGASRSAALAGAATDKQGRKSVAVGDHRIIQALVDQTDKQRVGVTRVVIYKAGNGPNGGVSEPPAACKTATTGLPSKNCNVYLPDDFGKEDAELEASTDGKGWPVAQRVLGTDYLGVYIEVKKDPILDWVPSPKSYSDYFVIRMNSEATSNPKDVQSANSWGNGNFDKPDVPHDANCWGGHCGDPAPPCATCTPQYNGGGG